MVESFIQSIISLSLSVLLVLSTQIIFFNMQTTTSAEASYKKLVEIPPVLTDGELAMIVSLAWHPRGDKLAVIYEGDDTIRIYDTKTGTVDFNVPVSEGIVLGRTRLSWSPDGKYLAGSFDITANPSMGRIKIWEVTQRSANLTTTIDRYGSDNSFLYWSPDGRKIANSHYISAEPTVYELQIWDTQTGVSLNTKKGLVLGSWSPDGKALIVFTTDEERYDLRVIDPTTFQRVTDFPIKMGEQKPRPFVSQASHKNLVAGVNCGSSANCALWLWNMETNQIKQDFETSEEANLSKIGTTSENFMLSPSGKILAKVYEDSLYLWDTGTGKLFTPLKTTSKIRRIVWHPDQAKFALALEDGSIQLWEVQFS